MDDDGINLEALEKKIQEYGEKVKFLYLCPSFNNPTGITLPEYKREAVYKLAQKYDFMIYEDDPYSRLSFDGNYLKEIKKYEKEGREWEEDYLFRAFDEAEELIGVARKRKMEKKY
jgi:2-aminoadipate transaminase